MSVSEAIRRELALLARRSSARVTSFSVSAPTDWRPQQVRNPSGVLDEYFTEAAAWELIAAKLDEGHPVEVVSLRKPAGRRGYVMIISLSGDDRPVYVKLQLQSGKVIGRSFHYSEHV